MFALCLCGVSQNIQDMFHAAGIELLSPHFMGVRKADRIYMPDEYLKKKETTAADEK